MPYLDGADLVDDGDLVGDVDLDAGADVELDEIILRYRLITTDLIF
jgi:hypothetical protein